MKFRRVLGAIIFAVSSSSIAGQSEINTESAERFTVAKKILEDATARGDLAVTVGIVGNSKKILMQHASGFRDEDGQVPMAVDSIIDIASMTKLVTTIATLQLVETGKVELDQGIDSYLPEFKSIQILESFDFDGNPSYSKPSRAPTIRELITHTSGFVYSIWNQDALTAQTKGITSGLSNDGKYIHAPLAFEPGTKWEYGIGIDWLGVLVEKVSGLTLLEYFSQHIFDPLGMPDTSYEFLPEKIHRSVTMMARVDGKLGVSSGMQPTPAEKGSMNFYGGGGGLYSTVGDYARLMQALLNGGTLEGNKILSETTVDEMFQNQIGDLDVSPGIARITSLSNDFDMGFGSAAKWGLGFLLHPNGTENGRSPGSVSWAGLFNSYFWIDREKDLFGVFATQTLPFYDSKSINTLKSFEKAVYGKTK